MYKPSGQRKTAKQYNKSSCQLQQFPLIKLHLFNDIQILNLGNNIISDLSALTIHNQSSQYALANLKIVNLSQNQFPNVASLEPLAQTAINIVSLNIRDNPLVKNLNFLYEIAMMFTNITKIECGFQVTIDNSRQEMIKQQKIGGRIISQFLQNIKDKTQNVKLLNIQSQQKRIVKMIEELQKPLYQITDKNRRIFQQMDSFINQSTPITSIEHTYRSPQKSRARLTNQIEIMSEYQITKQSNRLMRYLTESDQKPLSLNSFYYKELIYKKSIYAKIIQQIEVEQELLLELQTGNPNAIPYQHLLGQINNKWTNNILLTNNYEGKINKNKSYSPLKSIQTDMTSRVNQRQYVDNQYIYFGLDREWTYQTQNFIKHRLLSLLKAILKIKERGYVSPIQTFKTYLDSNSHGNNRQNEINYQTFGSFHIETAGWTGVQQKQEKVVSPKSKNKYIVGSLVNILQQIIKKIVMRKILQAKVVNYQDLNFLFILFSQIDKKIKEAAFRKIFKASVFNLCLEDKMKKIKLKKVFKAWKQMRKRKMRLIKMIINRKCKKQKCLQSVYLTQFRINTRNLNIQQKMKNCRSQFLKQSNFLADMSSILKKSVSLKQNGKMVDQKLLLKLPKSKFSTIKR